MNTNLTQLQAALKALEHKHSHELKGMSGNGVEWEAGFLAGISYVRKYVAPSFETIEKEECEAMKDTLEAEIEDVKMRHKLGIEESAIVAGDNERVKALSDALRDAISTFGNKSDVIVTEERKEAWLSVLHEHGE